MAAGGIADVRGVRAPFVLGAEGVYLETAFLATHKSRMAQHIKQMLVDSTADDLLLYRATTAHYRSRPTKLAQDIPRPDQRPRSGQPVGRLAGNGDVAEDGWRGDVG